MTHSFASDNTAPVHPEILAALAAVNEGHSPAYGSDPTTAALAERVAATFERGARTVVVPTGTGANILALNAAAPYGGGVVVADVAHVVADEAGAPARHGLTVLTCPTVDGRLTPDAITRWARDTGNIHHAQPVVVSITQATELGTVYSPDDVARLVESAHAAGMLVHMDGARIANAAVHLGVGLREAVGDVDLLSLGGTKNGGMGAEAVVTFSDDLASAVRHLHKPNLQLASKQRYLSAQLLALLDGDAPLWERCATSANARAAEIAAGLATPETAATGVAVVAPVEANLLFVRMPQAAADRVAREHQAFGTPHDDGTATVRIVCSWDTTPADASALLATIREEG
ncbi:L-threonine aldolase [Paraoerskovia marina]|uniref:L-threonine aldolase n=1 Tax=Paraoerskovia marina TaxID=545619 RepID=A0A1H1NPW3_9CELL|nr:beta-eliminating lyase-related protein [Paraoerskovia marina]SDS01054.1 L-threonine aldolase [Paraoerskovia marina]